MRRAGTRFGQAPALGRHPQHLTYPNGGGGGFKRHPPTDRLTKTRGEFKGNFFCGAFWGREAVPLKATNPLLARGGGGGAGGLTSEGDTHHFEKGTPLCNSQEPLHGTHSKAHNFKEE